MVRCTTVILALGTIALVLTPSNAWWSRRRRSCSAVHCRVSNWNAWSSCSRTCGGGLATRTRRKTVTESCGGGCAYQLKETKTCNTICCPVDCVYTWSPWSKCLGCGISNHFRTPVIQRHSSCNGKPCPAKQTKSCYTNV